MAYTKNSKHGGRKSDVIISRGKKIQTTDESADACVKRYAWPYVPEDAVNEF